VSSFTTPFADSLSAGIWSITVTDTLTGCTINQLFLITQPPNYNLTLSASSPTSCVSSSLGLSGQAIGGTPFANGTYNYNWQFGPAQSSQTITQNAAGAYTYTLNISDSLGCSINNTIAVSYIGNPTLVVVSASIC